MSLLTPEYDNVYVSLEQLAGTLEQLYRHKTTLLKTPLICQSDALSLEALVPGMISNRLPVASYTTDMSPVNVTPTVESIGDQLRSIRDRIVKVFKDLWAKLVGWFNSTFRDSAKKSDQAKKDAKDAQDKTNAIEPVEDKVINAITAEMSDKAGQPIKPAEVIATLHEEAIKVLEQHTSHNAYVVGRNTGYLTLFKNMAGTANVLKNLTAACEKLTATINAGGEVDTALYVVDLTSLGKLVDPSAKDAASTIEVLRGLAKLVADGRRPQFAEGDLKDLTDPKIQKFLKTSADLGNTIDDLQAVIETERGMDAVTKAIDHLDGSVKKIESPENASKVNTVIAEFRHVATVIGMIFGVVKDLHADVCITAAALNKAANGRYKALFSAINELPDRDDWLKQMASMKRSVGLESADFEVEDSVFEGNDSSDELSFDSHEVDEAHAIELTKALDDDHTEVSNLLTTSTTLENMGIESFTDTIKDVGKKIVAAIKAFIAKLKEWVKAVWSKIVGKQGDTANTVKDAKDTIKAVQTVEKPEKVFTEAIINVAKEVEKVPEAKRTKEQTDMLSLALFLVGTGETIEQASAMELKYNSFYGEIMNRHYKPETFAMVFNPDNNSKIEVFKAHISNILFTLSSVSRGLEHSIVPLCDYIKHGNKEPEDIYNALKGYSNELGGIEFAYNKPGTSISADVVKYTSDTFSTIGKANEFLTTYAAQVRDLITFGNTTSASTTIPQFTDLDLQRATSNAVFLLETVQVMPSKHVDECIKSLEFYATSMQSTIDFESHESDRALSREMIKSAISHALDVTKTISSVYTKFAQIAKANDDYLKIVNRVAKRRARVLDAACDKLYKDSISTLVHNLKENGIDVPKNTAGDDELSHEYVELLLKKTGNTLNTNLISDTMLASKAVIMAMKSDIIVKIIV